MVWTTPPSKSNEHKSWHRFSKGLCLYCGFYCIDCPEDVATCKCGPRPIHTFKDNCSRRWCRIHFWPNFGEHVPYPVKFRIQIPSRQQNNITVYCGPGAYLPLKWEIPNA